MEQEKQRRILAQEEAERKAEADRLKAEAAEAAKGKKKGGKKKKKK